MADLGTGSASGESEASQVQSQQECSSLNKNDYVMLKGHVCKIVEKTSTKASKHARRMIHLTGIDVFTGDKYEESCPSTQNMEVPCVEKRDYKLVNVVNDKMCLMDDSGGQRDDLDLPPKDLGEEMKEKFKDGVCLLVTVLKFMDRETATEIKPAP